MDTNSDDLPYLEEFGVHWTLVVGKSQKPAPATALAACA